MTDKSNLSVGARLLLLAAEKSGQILVDTTTGGLTVNTGGQFFGATPDNPRRTAEVESELSELAVYGLITPEGKKRTVTDRGYRWIEADRATEAGAGEP